MSKATFLRAAHMARGAAMGPFCGWDMPLHYKGLGIPASVLHTRKAASIFDVSHMGQVEVRGKHRVEFAERLTPAAVGSLPAGHHALSLMLNPQGGIEDDCIWGNLGSHLGLVVNAGNADRDRAAMEDLAAEMRSKEGLDITLDFYYGQRGLVALQGPQAADVLSRLLPKATAEALPKWAFMTSQQGVELAGVGPCGITRCGYTGEDGFEISVEGEGPTQALWEALASQAEVAPAGLVARDVLRLEAGLCLHGNDITPTTNPVDAVLMWTIPKDRRGSNFIGAEAVRTALTAASAPDAANDASQRRRVGLLVRGAIARDHSPIVGAEGEVIGEVTSGTHSPVVGGGIAMGYVPRPLSKLGSIVQVDVRGKLKEAEVVKLPFVPARYHRV